MADTTDLGADIILRADDGTEETYAAPAALRVDNTEGGTTDFVNEHLIDKLPAVTEADNGKVFGVVDGAWQAMNAPQTYTHPDTHPASMITGLSPAARVGEYDSLYGAPVGKRTILPLGDYQFTWSGLDGMNMCSFAIDETPAVGAACTVVWGEETFTAAVRQSDNWPRELGNASLFSPSEEDTGESFFFAFGEPGKIGFAAAATSGTVRCCIYLADEVRKLDAQYLPDGIATEDFVLEAVAANGGGSGGVETVETEILAETSFATMYLETVGCYVMDVPCGIDFSVGQEYVVRFDGTDYACTALDTSAMTAGTVGMGNGAPFGLPGNNEPFCLLDHVGGEELTVFCLQDTQETEHTISISRLEERTVDATTLPEFDLAAMGLPEVAETGTLYNASCDTAELMAALECSPVKIRMNALGSQVSGVLTAMKMNGTYQCGYVVILDDLPCLFTLIVGESAVAARIMVLAAQ